MRPLHIGIHQYSVEGAVLCFHEIMLEAQRRMAVDVALGDKAATDVARRSDYG